MCPHSGKWRFPASPSSLRSRSICGASGDQGGSFSSPPRRHERDDRRAASPDRLDHPLWRRLMRWETLLAAIAIAVFALNSFASPYFLDPWALSDLTFTFTEKGLIALPMALLIISGEFDLSVAAIMALASTLMGMAPEVGAGMP